MGAGPCGDELRCKEHCDERPEPLRRNARRSSSDLQFRWRLDDLHHLSAADDARAGVPGCRRGRGHRGRGVHQLDGPRRRDLLSPQRVRRGLRLQRDRVARGRRAGVGQVDGRQHQGAARSGDRHRGVAGCTGARARPAILARPAHERHPRGRHRALRRVPQHLQEGAPGAADRVALPHRGRLRLCAGRLHLGVRLRAAGGARAQARPDPGDLRALRHRRLRDGFPARALVLQAGAGSLRHAADDRLHAQGQGGHGGDHAPQGAAVHADAAGSVDPRGLPSHRAGRPHLDTGGAGRPVHPHGRRLPEHGFRDRGVHGDRRRHLVPDRRRPGAAGQGIRLRRQRHAVRGRIELLAPGGELHLPVQLRLPSAAARQTSRIRPTRSSSCARSTTRA